MLWQIRIGVVPLRISKKITASAKSSVPTTSVPIRTGRRICMVPFWRVSATDFVAPLWEDCERERNSLGNARVGPPAARVRTVSDRFRQRAADARRTAGSIAAEDVRHAGVLGGGGRAARNEGPAADRALARRVRRRFRVEDWHARNS